MKPYSNYKRIAVFSDESIGEHGLKKSTVGKGLADRATKSMPARRAHKGKARMEGKMLIRRALLVD